MEAKIFAPVKDALQAMVTGFLEGSKTDGDLINKALHQPFLAELITTFCPLDGFETKVNKMDEVFDNYPTFMPLREFCFDLLMINFFTADAKELDEGYLESEEWMAIEDKTLDRGTEFLNILLYVNECKEADAEISLDDFLKEFLLTEDDLYQDEYAIYEPIIKNQHLVDGSMQDIINAAAEIEDEEMQEIFVPLMAFFNDSESYAERLQQLIALSTHKPADTALFMALTTFSNSLDLLGE
jgi:hypothetical protein